MEIRDLIAQYGFPIALSVYLVWYITKVQNSRDAEITSAIKEQSSTTDALRKTINMLAIIVARGSGQDGTDLAEAERLAGISRD